MVADSWSAMIILVYVIILDYVIIEFSHWMGENLSWSRQDSIYQRFFCGFTGGVLNYKIRWDFSFQYFLPFLGFKYSPILLWR